VRDIYLILNTVIAIALILLSVISLINDRKPLLNKLFLAFSVSVGIWLVAACVSNDTRNSPTVSLYGNYLVFLFSYFASYLLLWFSVLITSLKSARNIVKYANIPLVLIGLLSATPLVVSGVELQVDVYAINFGPLAIIYLLALVFQCVGTLFILSKGLKLSSRHKRAQIRVIQRSLVVAFPILIATQFVAPAVTGSFEVTDIGILAMALPVISLYLSVIRHGLFDIRRAIIRSATYVFSLITLSFVYYLLAYATSVLLFREKVVSGVSVSPINIVMALILAFCFQPIKKFFDKITNSFFYKDNYNSDVFFARINRIATVTNDLRELLRSSANEIAATIKVDQVFFVVQKNGALITSGTNHHSKLPHGDVIDLNKLVKIDDGQPLDKNYLLSNTEDEFIRRMMISHRIELIIPLVLSNSIIGYLCLGEKKISRFNSHDINVLNTASDELSIAIQNALAVQEIREFNTTLQQRIANATRELRASNAQLQRLDKAKDEFVSMASHQLRTPLTTVKGYISMVMEGDAGEITADQRRLLDEAFMSSERMVNLINDFLNVSRIQTGKFVIDKHPTDLVKLVEQEIDRLKPNASSRKLDFIFKKPDNFPMINLDESKLREVVMNFADNALYYSHEGAKIDIYLYADKNNQAVFEVSDTGIGVPEEDKVRLFSKFYRAENAKSQRPDGTGVGLFLAKKVISAHGGKVIFESTEGKGSTFGFSLPIE